MISLQRSDVAGGQHSVSLLKRCTGCQEMTLLRRDLKYNLLIRSANPWVCDLTWTESMKDTSRWVALTREDGTA